VLVNQPPPAGSPVMGGKNRNRAWRWEKEGERADFCVSGESEKEKKKRLTIFTSMSPVGGNKGPKKRSQHGYGGNKKRRTKLVLAKKESFISFREAGCFLKKSSRLKLVLSSGRRRKEEGIFAFTTC